MAIFYFHGEDTFESFTKAKKKVAEIVSLTNFPIKIIDASDIKTEVEFMSNFDAISMFSSDNCYFVKRFSDNQKIAPSLVSQFETLSKFEIVFWDDRKLDGRKELSKFLAKKGVAFESTLLKEWQIEKWITDIVKAKKINLTQSQIKFIAESLEYNKWLIASELKKIVDYISVNKLNNLTDEDLNKILGFDIKGNIWKFLDYLGFRDVKKAVSEFEKLVTFEDSTQMLIAMLTREFGLMYRIITSSGEKSLGVHPFVLKKMQDKVKNFSKDEVRNFYFNLLDLDLKIKTGKIDPIIGFSTYLLSFKKS